MGFFDPLKPHVYGTHPHKEGKDGKLKANGPFIYAGSNRDAESGWLQTADHYGYSGGFGLYSGVTENGDARADVMQAQGHFGGWRDETGKTNWGAELDAAAMRLDYQPGNNLGPFGFGIEMASANGGLKINEETTSLGAQANAVGGNVTLAGEDPLTGNYSSVKGGLSLGVGFAGRLHYGDADGDGIRELGLGADFGPFQADIKSEYLGQAWNGISSGASSAWDSVTSW